MLNHPTLDKLKALKLPGMVQGLLDQAQHPAIDQLSFEERLVRVSKVSKSYEKLKCRYFAMVKKARPLKKLSVIRQI